MPATIYVTRQIPEVALAPLRACGVVCVWNREVRALSR
jgi:hypothetical protein